MMTNFIRKNAKLGSDKIEERSLKKCRSSLTKRIGEISFDLTCNFLFLGHCFDLPIGGWKYFFIGSQSVGLWRAHVP